MGTIQTVPECSEKSLCIIILSVKMAAFELNTCWFMEEVQKYESLYKFSKDYKKKYLRVKCWEKMVKIFQLALRKPKKKYKNIRTAYDRNKTKNIVASPALRFTVAIFKLYGAAPKIVRPMPFTCIIARVGRLRESMRSSGFHIIVPIAPIALIA